jgi:hypothetical protein
MLDKMLSKSGRWVAGISCMVFGGLALWAAIAKWGPAAWLIDLQGQLTGYYSLKLTGVLLLLPGLLAGYGLGFLWDSVTRQGRWSQSRAKVYIIASSPGPAPGAFREAWVGLVVPLVTDEPVANPDTGEPCYLVSAEAGLAVLAQASPEAAAWWRQQMPDLRGKAFRFPASACKRV